MRCGPRAQEYLPLRRTRLISRRVAAVFFPFFGKLCPTIRDGELTVEEFIVTVHCLCSMNDEEITRHVFSCLVTGKDAFGEPCVDLIALEKK